MASIDDKIKAIEEKLKQAKAQKAKADARRRLSRPEQSAARTPRRLQGAGGALVLDNQMERDEAHPPAPRVHPAGQVPDALPELTIGRYSAFLRGQSHRQGGSSSRCRPRK